MGRTRKQVGTSLCYDTHLGAQSTSHEEIRGPLWCAANARAQCQQSFFCPWIGCSPFTTLRQWYSQLQYTHTEYHRVFCADLDWFGLIWSPSRCHVRYLWSSRSVSLSFASTFLTFLHLPLSSLHVPWKPSHNGIVFQCNLSMLSKIDVFDTCYIFLLFLYAAHICVTLILNLFYCMANEGDWGDGTVS
jgi:hypothetical protein